MRPRATDYLSEAVERRAQGRSAIVSGEDMGGVDVSRKPHYPRRRRTVTMDVDDAEAGPPLRPVKGPVAPVPKADLVPAPRISVSQSSLLSRLAPSVNVEPDPADEPVERVPAPAARAPADRAPEVPVRTRRSFAAEADSDGPHLAPAPAEREPAPEAAREPAPEAAREPAPEAAREPAPEAAREPAPEAAPGRAPGEKRPPEHEPAPEPEPSPEPPRVRRAPPQLKPWGAELGPAPVPQPKPKLEPWGRRATRTVEVPEPVERRHAPREFYVPEWDRYYNPGFLPRARIPEMKISRAPAAPEEPAWMLVGRPRGMGRVASSRAPYRASLKEGARVKSSRPRQEVERFLEHRDAGDLAELEGPAGEPEDLGMGSTPGAGGSDGLSANAGFEQALAELEASFQSDQPATVQVPARAVTRAAAPARQAPRVPPPARAADPHPDVVEAASRAMPATRSALRPAPRPVARRRGDENSEEDESEISPGDEEEGTLGPRPPPDRLQEQAAHQPLAHDATGASLCPTCGRRVTPSNPVLVCTSCGRVACASCGKFSAGEPTGNIYQYEYQFNFPLCHPCFERHYTVQKNLARGRAYLASGNLTYAFYHAQTALKSDPESPYVHDAEDLLKQVEARRAQIKKADKEWEEARKKLMRDRTSVLK